MNRNDYHHHGDHRRAPLLARKVSSSSSCEEPTSSSSSAQHAAPHQDQDQQECLSPRTASSSSGSARHASRDQQDLLSPLRASPSSPVASPRMAPRAIATVPSAAAMVPSAVATAPKAAAPRSPTRTTPRMARFNPKVLVRRTSSGLRDELGDLIGELSLSSNPQPPRTAAKQSVVTPETSMDANPPPHTAAHTPHVDDAAAAAKREKFLLFVRILFKCLDAHPSVPPALRVEAKRVIRECTAKNRAGVPGYSPLVDALESRLREVDGMGVHWERAEGYLRHYLVMRGQKLLAMKRAKGKAPPVMVEKNEPVLARPSPEKAASSDCAGGGGGGDRSATPPLE